MTQIRPRAAWHGLKVWRPVGGPWAHAWGPAFPPAAPARGYCAGVSESAPRARRRAQHTERLSAALRAYFEKVCRQLALITKPLKTRYSNTMKQARYSHPRKSLHLVRREWLDWGQCQKMGVSRSCSKEVYNKSRLTHAASAVDARSISVFLEAWGVRALAGAASTVSHAVLPSTSSDGQLLHPAADDF